MRNKETKTAAKRNDNGVKEGDRFVSIKFYPSLPTFLSINFNDFRADKRGLLKAALTMDMPSAGTVSQTKPARSDIQWQKSTGNAHPHITSTELLNVGLVASPRCFDNYENDTSPTAKLSQQVFVTVQDTDGLKTRGEWRNKAGI